MQLHDHDRGVTQCDIKVTVKDVIKSIVSPSEVIPPLAERLMHMVHTIVNTSGVSKSSFDWLNSSGNPVDVCLVFV